MTVENATLISQLNTAWPLAADLISEGDDHLRLIKLCLRTNFPNIAGIVTPSHLELNYVAGVTSALQPQIDAKAPLANPTFTGVVTVPTRAVADNTTAAASTAFVQGEFGSKFPGLSAPITATSAEMNRMVGVTGPVQGQIDAKGAIAGQAWNGSHNFAAASGVTLPAATTVGAVTAAELAHLSGITAPVQGQINAKGAISGQAWSGAHDFTAATTTVSTQAAGDASTKAASTAFVAAAAFSGVLPGQSGNANKVVTTDGVSAYWGWPVLPTQEISVNTTMVPGVHYVVKAAGITLTAPAVLLVGDPLSAEGAVAGDYFVNWSGHTVKDQTPDSPMRIPALRGFSVVYTGVTLA